MKFLIASDNISRKSKDRKLLNQVCSKLQKQGHTVVNCGVGPNNVQRRSLHEKGEYNSVQIIGGIDGWTYADFANGIKRGYYHCKEVYFLCTSWYFSPSSIRSKKGLKTYKMERAHDAGATLQSMYKGKTVEEFMKKYPMVHIYACDSVEEMVNILAYGKSDSEDQKKGSLSEQKEQQKTYRNVLEELISPIRGLIQINFQSWGDQIHIKKAVPYNNQKEVLWIDEELNLTQITPKAYNPNTVNTLVVMYGDKNYITIRDNLLVEMFGEKVVKLAATKYVVRDEKYMQDMKLALLERQARAEERAEELKNKEKESKKKSKQKTKTKKKDPKKAAEERKKEKEKEEEERKKRLEQATDYDKNSVYGVVKIDNYEEALDFAYTKFYENLLNRIEPIDLTVIGSEKYVVGKWVKINNSRNGFVADMVITSVKHNKSATTEWLTQLTCHPYYPHITNLEIKTVKKEMEKLEK